MTGVLTMRKIMAYEKHLEREEKSPATIEKYLRCARTFADFLGKQRITKEIVCAYKKHLEGIGYAVRTINGMLAAINSLLAFLGLKTCMVKIIRTQKETYCEEKKELTREEYMRLLDASKSDPQLNLMMQTISGTGIRVSELKFFTVEAVQSGRIQVNCKKKVRVILLPELLRDLLLTFAEKNGIVEGPIFINSIGKSVDRSVIWRRMKALYERADVSREKVFPHNLRKLFARCFYDLGKDVSKLADVLGHSSIETTRIYIMTSGQEHQAMIECLGLVQNPAEKSGKCPSKRADSKKRRKRKKNRGYHKSRKKR